METIKKNQTPFIMPHLNIETDYSAACTRARRVYQKHIILYDVQNLCY